MFTIIGWVVFGAIVGWLANLLVGDKKRGCIVSVILGIVGSMLGGYIFNYFGKQGVTGFNLYSVMVGVVGAVVVTVIFGVLSNL